MPKVLDLRRTRQWLTRRRGRPFMVAKEHRGIVGLADSIRGVVLGWKTLFWIGRFILECG